MFLGTTQLSPPGYGAVAGIELEDMNRDGVVAWSAWSSVGTRPVHDVYRNDVNLSEPVLGLYREVTYHSRVNAHGDVLWSGYGPNTGGKDHLFLNQTSLTAGLVDGHRGIDVEGLNDRGDYVWLLIDGAGSTHLYLNRENLSRKVFGTKPYTVFHLANRLSEAGDVLWAAVDKTTDIAMLFLNETEISHSVLGIDPDWPYTTVGAAFGFDARGNYVWSGTGPNTGYAYHTFFNEFDVSLDAIPSGDIYHSQPLALNSRGDLFWGAMLNDGSIWLYRSRLVCEPHTALGLLLLPLLRRRRRSGGRVDAGL
ncbi:MAG: hypothetical protein HRF45_13905 [Fimbriimonadia bacterium]